MMPLDRKYPTLAEHLGLRGYATAGFVANLFGCSYDSGLNRGFTHYEDYTLDYLVPLRMAWLVDHLARVISGVGTLLGHSGDAGYFRPLHESWLSPYFDRLRKKDAGLINRAFLEWLSHRSQPARPFFAFLNYFDAHAPFVLPEGTEYRFGLRPRRPADFTFLEVDWELNDKMVFRPVYHDWSETPTTTAWLTSTGDSASCSMNCNAAASSIRRC